MTTLTKAHGMGEGQKQPSHNSSWKYVSNQALGEADLFAPLVHPPPLPPFLAANEATCYVSMLKKMQQEKRGKSNT